MGTNSVLPTGTAQARVTAPVPSEVARNHTSPCCFASHSAPVVSEIGLLPRGNAAIHCSQDCDHSTCVRSRTKSSASMTGLGGSGGALTAWAASGVAASAAAKVAARRARDAMAER